jgi:hypothetical protein
MAHAIDDKLYGQFSNSTLIATKFLIRRRAWFGASTNIESGFAPSRSFGNNTSGHVHFLTDPLTSEAAQIDVYLLA